MSRPKDNRCHECRRPLPEEAARDELTIGTDVCLRCASVNLSKTYRSSRAAREWLAAWRDRLNGLLQHQEPDR